MTFQDIQRHSGIQLGGPIQLTKYVKQVCDDESEIEGYTKKASE